VQKIQLGLNDPNQDFINREKNSDVEEFKQHFYALSAKLHYTDTGYGHVVQRHQQTPPTDELTTILQIVVQQIRHQLTEIVALRCGKFVVQQVVELLRDCPLVVL